MLRRQRRLRLIADQFEDLYTPVPSEERRQRFANLLAAVREDSRLTVR